MRILVPCSQRHELQSQLCQSCHHTAAVLPWLFLIAILRCTGIAHCPNQSSCKSQNPCATPIVLVKPTPTCAVSYLFRG